MVQTVIIYIDFQTPSPLGYLPPTAYPQIPDTHRQNNIIKKILINLTEMKTWTFYIFSNFTQQVKNTREARGFLEVSHGAILKVKAGLLEKDGSTAYLSEIQSDEDDDNITEILLWLKCEMVGVKAGV